jgi:capsular polysaccharide biosynthesis protein
MQMRFRSGDAMLTSSDVESDKVTLRHYKQIIMSLPWWITPMFVAIGLAIAYLITKQITPTYQVSTSFMVNKVNYLQTSNYDSVFVSENLARTYAEMITSENILVEVAQQLGISISSGELGSITATPIINTQLIEINVEHSDPVLAAKIANTMVSIFSKQIDQAQLDSAANQDKVLEAQIHETEDVIAKLQEEIKKQSVDGYEQQLERINKIIEDLGKQIDQVDQRIIPLSQARKNELSSLLLLYQEQYVLLNVTGPKLGSQDVESEQIIAALDQYRRTYNSLVQNYSILKTTRVQDKIAVIQVDKAVVPVRPIRPNLLINLAVVFAAGLLLAVVYIFSKLDTK